MFLTSNVLIRSRDRAYKQVLREGIVLHLKQARKTTILEGYEDAEREKTDK